MKNLLITLSLTCSAVLFSAAPAKADSLQMAASRISGNLNYLYEQSVRSGDFGYALSDLGNLRMAATSFLYTPDYRNYIDLENAYRMSSSSWVQLNSYRYEMYRYIDVQSDFNTISSIMRFPAPDPRPFPFPRPLPRPPERRAVSVTSEGTGGTTRGDRDNACQLASQRSLDSLTQNCGNQRGLLLSSSVGSCDCHKHPGSRDDYTCKVVAVGTCQL